MDLNGKWKLYYYEYGKKQIEAPTELVTENISFITATVPGNVELDLSAVGLLPKDLFFGENILEAESYEKYDWWYEKSFIPSAPTDQKRVVLRFSGVDCYAVYFLNDEKIGESCNMFIEHCFDVTDLLRYGEENTIHIHIISSVAGTSDYEIEPYLIHRSWHRRNFSAFCRKAPHSYGWDIMPRALSAGLWRDVSLSYDDLYGFSYLYFLVDKIEGEDADIILLFDAHIPSENTYDRMYIEVCGFCGDSTFSVKHEALCKCGKFKFRINDVKLWWPRNYGEPNLYTITVKAYNANREFLFDSTVKRGFRTIKLDRTDTLENGNGAFRFIVNNTPISVVGSNWVPMDAYHSRDKQRYKNALDMAVDIGCNILRCWGGNVYEDTEFFDFCDENGILVWQDFAMACQYYPQSEEFIALIREEAECVVKKLCQHPSLCLWCGDNEVDYMLFEYGIKPSENKLTREILADVVSRLDPAGLYIDSSPYISDRAFLLGEDSFPEHHLWGPRNYFKSSYYTDSRARFISETGYHGCPSSESIRRFIAPEYLWPYTNNRQWNLHSTDQENSDARVKLMETQIREFFGTVPTDMEEYISASQLSQAEAYKFFIERVRADMANMGGVIWWNLVDGWPQMSDAVVDYYYNKKAAYDFIKRSSQPFIILMGEYNEGHHELICANSTLRKISGSVTVTDAQSGRTVYTGTFESLPNRNFVITNISAEGQGMYFISWTGSEISGSNTYLYGNAPFDLQSYKSWLNSFYETYCQ